jgi:hypothetical protein
VFRITSALFNHNAKHRQTTQKTMKNPSRNYLTIAMVALLGGFAATAQAQTTVFSENFESYAPGANELAPWSDTSPPLLNASLTIGAGAGAGGSQGLLWQGNFTPFTWHGWMQGQLGYGGPGFGGTAPSGNTSLNLSDYTLSFDMAVPSGVTLGNLQLNIQGWTDPAYGGVQTETGGHNIPTGMVGVGTGFQTISVNLGTWAAGSGFNPASGTYQFQWQVNGWELANGGSNGEKVVIDNVFMTMAVPEPSSLALIGIGAAGLFWLRRKNS